MKKSRIQQFAILIAIFLSALSYGNTPEQIREGIYTSDHGPVVILPSKNGGKTVGVYQNVGFLTLSSFTISGRATTYTGSFNNKSKAGYVSFTKKTNGWNGKWRWKTDAINSWQGSWGGDYWKILPRNSTPLTRKFVTEQGEMELIQWGGNTAGFLYANDGKTYYMYGNYTGGLTDEGLFSGKMGTSDDMSDGSHKPFQIHFNTTSGHGYVTLKIGRRNTRVDWPKLTRIKLKLEKIKNYESGRGNEVQASAKLDARIYDTFGNQVNQTLYNVSNKKWEKNKEYPINTTHEFNLYFDKYPGKKFSNVKLDLQFTSKRRFQVSNAQENLKVATIDLYEIMQYLDRQKNANQFSNGPDGRKRIANTDHTFWLESTNHGALRVARGYGFTQLSNNYKWGYFYTLEYWP